MSSAATREIVTLQFGHYANFVGTHWWNIQNSSFVYKQSDLSGPKEINNDVLFREGENHMREVTYTPRLIAFDLKGSLNTLKENGTLYDVRGREDDISWLGDVTMHKLSSASKNRFLDDLDYEEAAERGLPLPTANENEDTEKDEMVQTDSTHQHQASGTKFYDLDKQVTVWSDYLRLHLHPKSLQIVKNYRHENELEKFDVFGRGTEVYKDQYEEIEDRLHFFAEECDYLEGFVFMVDTYNAFGGLASSFLEDVLDDYSKKARMVYSVTPATFSSAATHEVNHRLVNLALSYGALLPQSSIFLPLSTSSSSWKGSGPFCEFQNVQYNPNLNYHTSALLAAGIDTMTLPFRLETGSLSLTNMADLMTPLGRKLVSTHLSFPFPANSSKGLLDALAEPGINSGHLFHSLTPSVPACNAQPHSQHTVCRGVESSYTPGPGTSEPSANSSPVQDVLSVHMNKLFKSRSHYVCAVRQSCKVFAPFPHIFSPYLTVDGLLSRHKRSANQGVQSVAAMCSLQSSSDGRVHLDSILTEVARLKAQKLHSFLEAGMELDQFNEMLEVLQMQAACYDTEQMDMM